VIQAKAASRARAHARRIVLTEGQIWNDAGQLVGTEPEECKLVKLCNLRRDNSVEAVAVHREEIELAQFSNAAWDGPADVSIRSKPYCSQLRQVSNAVWQRP
jgi:hypothetical protein